MTATAPCNCPWGKTHPSTCRCPWRSHLTQPTRVELPYLFDDGSTVRTGTLSGSVSPTGDDVDEMELLLDGGEEVVLRGADRRDAKDELRQAAAELWGRKAS